jgi:hypothetical protein
MSKMRMEGENEMRDQRDGDWRAEERYRPRILSVRGGVGFREWQRGRDARLIDGGDKRY